MEVLTEWHRIAQQRDTAGLPAIIAEDCVFYSPVVYSPQRGRDLTVLYLSGAMQVFNDSFHYVKEVVQAPHAVLEFECEVEGVVINGVDIIVVNQAGLISEFRVMIRPLKGIEMMQRKMREMLEQLSS